MPTGYTAALYEGKDVDFATFVLKCARGWGAAVLLRDAAPDVLPTEENVVESKRFVEDSLEAAHDKLVLFSNISDEQLRDETQAYNDHQAENRAKSRAENARRREAYEEMLNKVRAWVPPTENHIKFKEFMIDQLKTSIDHDVHDDTDPWYASRTPEEHKAAQIAEAERSISRNTEELDKICARNKERARWVRELRESLEGVTT